MLRHVPDYLRGTPVFAIGAPPAGALRLDLNEGAYGPTPSARAAITAMLPSLNRYPDADGGHGLRAALAERLAVSDDALLFGAGSNSLQGLLIRICAGPGARVAYSWPGFPTFGWAARRCGADPVPVPTRRDGTDDLDALLAAARSASVVVLATPNNPTGRVVTEGLEAFVAEASQHALVLIDEAYHEYAPTRTTGVDLFRAGHEVIVLRTFSKAWGLAGCRIGYAILAPALQRVARSVQETFEVSALSYVAARASLDDHAIVAERLAENATVRAALESCLGDCGADPWTSAANFVSAGPPDPERFAERMAAEGIIVRVTTAFGDPARVRIGVPGEADAPRVFAAIGRAVG